MKKSQDVYMEPEVFHYENCIITVSRPIFTEEERARRMERIKKTAIDLVIETEKRKNKVNKG